MQLEKIHGVPRRIAALKQKLAAREGKAEFKHNCEMIRAEIARLEAVSIKPAPKRWHLPMSEGDTE